MTTSIDTHEPEINEAVKNAITWLMEPLPNPIVHGDFNRRMFLEAVFIKAGHGCSISDEDIMNYACMTQKEFDSIEREYMTQGVIKKQENPFGIHLYAMNM